MDMKYDTRLNSSSVDAILVVFADLFTINVQRKQTNENPSLLLSPEILLRANFVGFDTPG